MGDGTGGAGGATHLMLRLGASVHNLMGAVRSVVKVGRVAVPTVTGLERVRVAVAVADSDAGLEPRKSRLWDHSQNGGLQVGERGVKMMRVHFMSVVGAVAFGGGVVRVVEVFWLGQSE